MQNSCKNIKSFNILSAALCLFAGGICTCVPALKTGMPIWSALAGGMVGTSLGLTYLGMQWENKNLINTVLGVLVALISAVSVSVSLLAIQGNIN